MDLYLITYKGSPIARSIPVDRATGELAIRLLVEEDPSRKYDYDLAPWATVATREAVAA